MPRASLSHWPGSWQDQSDPLAPPHEASLHNLVIDKAHHELGWSPRWAFATTVERTVSWCRQVKEGQASALACCFADLKAFQQACSGHGRERRLETFADLQALAKEAGTPVFDPSPEVMIRQDRAN